MNFFILNALPLPRLGPESALRRDIVVTAGRLACPDDRFSEVVAAIGVECGPLEPAEKTGLVARLDALAAHAYGLTEADLELMFEDFPDTEAGVPAARREEAVRVFRELANLREEKPDER